MNFMNKHFSLFFTAVLPVVALCALMPAPASAQTYGVPTLTTPTNVLASTASNTTAVVNIQANRNVSVDFQFQGDAAGTANVTAFFIPSLDNITYDNTKGYVLIAAANGTTKVNVTTNWDFGAYGYVKLSYITNAAATANITNVVVKVGLKPNN
jgi:hypothetical protein